MVINKKQTEIHNVRIFSSNIEDSAVHLSKFHVNCLAKFTEKVGTCHLPVDVDTCMLCDVLNFTVCFSFFSFFLSLHRVCKKFSRPL